jgi:hypothetical protein
LCCHLFQQVFASGMLIAVSHYPWWLCVIALQVSGFVPCYAQHIAAPADRVLCCGDSSGNRSALSLAGFCSVVRNLPRLQAGITGALAAGKTGCANSS